MKEKVLSMMEKVAMKLISMWQIDLVLGIAGVAIFYLVQRWREKEEKKKKKIEEAKKNLEFISNDDDGV
jgi:cytochrome c oxidase assembly factor CtaG